MRDAAKLRLPLCDAGQQTSMNREKSGWGQPEEGRQMKPNDIEEMFRRFAAANPNPRGEEKKLVLDLEKANAWIKQGAQPTDRVKNLIKMAQAGQ